MIDSWSAMKSYIRADLRSRGDTRFLRVLIFDPVARFTMLMRLLEYLANTGKPRLIRLPLLFWYRRLSVRLGFSVAPGIFGPGLAIVHYGLLVIDPTTRIGRNCRIHQGVNIGGAAQFVAPAEMHKYSPRIGDNVYIGPGAKLYGPVVIGDNCVIGANAVVTRSFPEAGLTLAGVPAKVIAEGGTGERVLRGAD
ncbi:MAG: DapH/DapD/GlmU-related protein [Sphingomicrobium sp.]